MSQQKSSAQVSETFSETEIGDYLRSHPDFFERHASVLLGLKLPHHTGGSAVSLVERQVSMLRQRNAQLERQLKELVAVARLNTALVEKMHQLSVKLAKESGLERKLEQLESSLREDFSAERAAVVLFSVGENDDVSRAGFVQRIDRSDAALKPFSSFLRAARPRCGPMRDRQRELIFGREADSIVSAAMVPLGDGAKLGFLVIGSRDPDHFNPGKHMDFLSRLGELVSVAIEREQTGSDGH